VSAASAYSPLLAHVAWRHQSICLCRAVFGRRMFTITSNGRIPEFGIQMSFAHHIASTLTPASAITRFTVTSFAAWDEAYCNLDDRFLVLFAMSFIDTRILIRKCRNIPTSNLRGDHYCHSRCHVQTSTDDCDDWRKQLPTATPRNSTASSKPSIWRSTRLALQLRPTCRRDRVTLYNWSWSVRGTAADKLPCVGGHNISRVNVSK